MSNRLDAIAGLIKNGRGVADVGTDHGYIPVELAKRGYAGNIIATDINSGPLKSAENSASAAGVEDRIKLILCDGLSGVKPEQVDTIVVAGMGGDTVAGILDRDYWCAADGYSLILQPMTHQNVLRYWLINNGFTITREILVRDAGTIYQIICARCGSAPEYSDSELFTGKFELVCNETLFPEYLDGLIKKFSLAVAGMEAASAPDMALLDLNIRLLRELKDMKARLYNGKSK